jgi:hypothetical protein
VYRRRAFVTIVVACVLALPAIALATTDHSPRGSTGVQTTTPTSTIPNVTPTPKATLEFRPIDYDGDSPLEFPADAAPCSATPGATGASGASGAPGRPDDVVLFDRDHRNCYMVRPAVLTGTDLASASVLYDSASSQWAVNFEWNNNDFVTDVARPYVINPGITGRSVEITGNLTRTDAVDIAASVLGIAPSAVQIDTGGAPDGNTPASVATSP